MFRIILALLLMTTPAWSAQWRAGTGQNTILGSSLASDIDSNTFNSIVNPLDNLLATYCNEYLTYSSASNITVSAGSVMVSNSDGSIRLMLRNSSPTTVDFTMIDTGVEASGTTYYIYAIAASSSSTAATYKVSASSSAPSGVTYYYKIGSFLNDGSSNITTINNVYYPNEMNTWFSKSIGTNYQALTDGFACGTIISGGSGSSGYLTGYTDSASVPATVHAVAAEAENSQADHSVTRNAFCMPVKSGDYYRIDQATWGGAASGGSATMYFLSTN